MLPQPHTRAHTRIHINGNEFEARNEDKTSAKAAKLVRVCECVCVPAIIYKHSHSYIHHHSHTHPHPHPLWHSVWHSDSLLANVSLI